jgi:cysteine desulfurase
MPYLDANATEPLRPEARAAMLAALDATGNPSSVHRSGRAARRIVEDAREALAARFGGSPSDLVFVSGGTEADALAIHALGRGRRVIIGATEHDAVRSAAPEALVLPVDRDGVADLDALRRLLQGKPPALVCLMIANNETGTIQPIRLTGELCRAHGALLHVDAAQAAGRLPNALRAPGSCDMEAADAGDRVVVSLAELGCHSLALSSHKLGGPGGIGALLLAADHGAIPPLIAGGGQERGRRGGTLAAPLIAGFAAAATTCRDARFLAPLRDAAERAALAVGAVVCGGGARRLPNTTCLALPGVRADAQVIALDLDGVAVSAGAACSSGKVAASHVLAAMGLGALASQAIRVSLPWNATMDDVDTFIAAYQRMADRLRAPLAPRAA